MNFRIVLVNVRHLVSRFSSEAGKTLKVPSDETVLNPTKLKYSHLTSSVMQKTMGSGSAGRVVYWKSARKVN